MKTAEKKEQHFKAKSIILLLGSFESSFYDFTGHGPLATVHCVLEGRPTFASSRAACRELLKRRITPTVIADNSAGFLFARGWVKEAWVAYQAKDKDGVIGDSGALILGVLAKYHGVPLFAAPGMPAKKIMAAAADICSLNGKRVAPVGVKGYAPLLEFLPKKYVREING